MRLLLVAILTLPLYGQERPNILWITSEDNGPHLGCYGDPDAVTPHLDALAARGLRFERAWSNAPVCAPARTTIITGMYATSLGAEHMRSMVDLPAGVRLFPALLREHGYYCSNRSKEDYNVPKAGDVWDASSRDAHWRGRAQEQPFFSVMNLTTTHEGQIRRRPHQAVHDPAKVRVPAYHPDDPVVRQDWAQYHDKMTEMDAQVGRILGQLEEDGLVEQTIVIYFGDHGPGMPRCKRWPYDSGLRVPMIVHVPLRFAELAPTGYAPGASSERLVSFVDLAPTMLSLAGVERAPFHQGSAFAGTTVGPAPTHLFGFRGRMDERVDLVRSVTDGRFVYIRNYMPWRIQGAHLAYMFQTPSTRRWKELYELGALSEPGQRRFWEPKAVEELYDLEQDPDEVVNLLNGRAGRVPAALDDLRAALGRHLVQSGDRGLQPEGVHSPAKVTDLLGVWSLETGYTKLASGLQHEDASVRAASALRLAHTELKLSKPVLEALVQRLDDESVAVRVASAEALALRGKARQRAAGRRVLLSYADLTQASLFDALAALNALDGLNELTSDDVTRLAALARKSEQIPSRLAGYVPRLLDHIAAKHPGPRTSLIYKEVGEIKLELFVHQPRGAAPTNGRGAVVFFHGGGWRSGDPGQFFDQCEHLARHGVVAISAAYRLGKTHGATPAECVADAKSALRWVRSHAAELGIDPDRIAAGGGSAGGHLAAAAATTAGFDDALDSKVSCLPNALLLFNPVCDNGPGGWGHDRVKDDWQAISPLHNIRAGIAPSLFLLGTRDALVPVSVAQRWEARVKEVGGRCEVKLFDGQTHGFFNQNHSEPHYRATVAAMDSFLASLGWFERE